MSSRFPSAVSPCFCNPPSTDSVPPAQKRDIFRFLRSCLMCLSPLPVESRRSCLQPQKSLSLTPAQCATTALTHGGRVGGASAVSHCRSLLQNSHSTIGIIVVELSGELSTRSRLFYGLTRQPCIGTLRTRNVKANFGVLWGYIRPVCARSIRIHRHQPVARPTLTQYSGDCIPHDTLPRICNAEWNAGSYLQNSAHTP